MRAIQPNLRAVIVGNGPLEQDLRRDHPDIIFSGARVGEDLAEHYASADWFVFPSLSETFGNVLLEAMASGLAPLAFDYAAARHLLVDEKHGLVARVNDEEHFIEQAKRLASSPEWAQTLGTAARQRAETQTWSMIAQQLEAMWREITPETGSQTRQASQAQISVAQSTSQKPQDMQGAA